MNKQELKEISTLIEMSIRKARASVEALHGERHNPSVTDVYYKAMGRVDALEAVQEALRGSKISLKLLAQ